MKKINIGELITRHRIVIIIVFSVLLGASVISSLGISINTQFRDLLKEDNKRVQAFQAVLDNFNTTSTVIVALEGGSIKKKIEAAEALAMAVKEHSLLSQRIQTIQLKADPEFVQRWGLQIADDETLETAAFAASSPNLIAFSKMLSMIYSEEASSEIDKKSEKSEQKEELEMVSRTISSLNALADFQTDPEKSAEALVNAFLDKQTYMFSDDYSMLVFQITPNFSIEERAVLTEFMKELDPVIKRIEKDFPDIHIGTAGDIPQEADEEAAMGFDLIFPALLSLIAIIFLFFIFLNGFRSVTFAALALVTGIILDMGIIGITIKELNMITSSFGALLIGLGIDFGIHVINGYNENIRAGHNRAEAVTRMLRKTGKPVLIGGLTTALAFYALCFSGTKGFVQFGVVAGSGIITVLLSMLIFLPAVLATFGKTKAKAVAVRTKLFSDRFFSPSKKMRIIVISAVAIITIFNLLFALNLEFDPDIRKIGPQNTPTKMTEKKIEEKLDISPFPSLYITEDLSDAREISIMLKQNALVNSVDSLSDIIPAEGIPPERLEQISAINQILKTQTAGSVPDHLLDILAASVENAAKNALNYLKETEEKADSTDNPNTFRSGLENIFNSFGNPQEIEKRLSNSFKGKESADFSEALKNFSYHFSDKLIKNLLTMTNETEALKVSLLPKEMRDQYISKDGSKYLVTIFPWSGMNSKSGMIAFDQAMNSIDPKITGTVSLALELSDEISSEITKTGLIVLIIVTLLLVLTFRSIKYTLLSLVNLAISSIWMLGLYSLYDQMNIVNMLAVPLIIGIGIDYSIHIIHAYRERDFEHIRTTAKAIILSALTTMIGFGSLALIGSFRGIATLGMILFLGAGSCLVMSLTFIPAVIGGKENKMNR